MGSLSKLANTPCAAACVSLLVIILAISLNGRADFIPDTQLSDQERIVLDRMLILHDAMAPVWHPLKPEETQ